VAREDGLFPYSTLLADGAYVNDYAHPSAIRYSINSLLGLQEAAVREPRRGNIGEVSQLVERFLRNHYARIDDPADLGLLLVLLCGGDQSSPWIERALARVQDAARSPAVERMTMQTLSWMLWGACRAAHAGAARAAAVVGGLGDLVLARFVDPKTLMPRHTLARYRRDFVSFGAVTYFLRAMTELGDMRGDARASRAFDEGVRTMLAVQGARGEWPWLISVRRRVPLDFYPVFTVHQDSMSMLFLLPALDRGHDVADAIGRSFAWALGGNELATPMVRREPAPFVAYRSIERSEGLPRARRYLRMLGRSISRSADVSGSSDQVRINPECRSYHVGWLLYAWAGREHVPGLPPGDA
jgi:hypothetical protein